MNQLELFFAEISEEWSEVVVAELADVGYNSFWHDEDGLRAYISESEFDENVVKELVAKYEKLVSLTYKINETIPGKWQRVQEDFEPFVIADQILIKRSKEQVFESAAYELILDAQMAFGSGKHPSTVLCMEQMLTLNVTNTTVLDVGTGSGVLAILAEKMGANKIDAFDNNPWAVEVAGSLLESNDLKKTSFFVGDIDTFIQKCNTYDLVLANLNFDVLSTEMQKLPDFLNANGVLVVSGFMRKDKAFLEKKVAGLGLKIIGEAEKETWQVLVISR